MFVLFKAIHSNSSSFLNFGPTSPRSDPMANRYTLSVYAPLNFNNIPNYPHDMPTSEYKEVLPKFSSNMAISVEDHLTQFGTIVENMEIEYEDIVMKMFVQTLEGDVRAWYKSLGVGTVGGWEAFKMQFSTKWGGQTR